MFCESCAMHSAIIILGPSIGCFGLGISRRKTFLRPDLKAFLNAFRRQSRPTPTTRGGPMLSL